MLDQWFDGASAVVPTGPGARRKIDFKIIVDAHDDVTESNEDNNTAAGVCIG